MEKAIVMKPLAASIQIVIGLCLLLFVSNVNGQDFKLGGLKYAYYPQSEMKEGDNGEKTSFNEFGFFINIPKKIKSDSTILVNGVGYGSVNATMYNFSGAPSNEFEKKLEMFYYQVTLLRKWKKDWTFVSALKPTLASDFEEKLSIDDFVLQGAALVSKKMNDKVMLGGGIAHSTRWGTPIVVPTFSFRYKHKKHTVNALLPIKCVYNYSLLPKNNLKLGFKYIRNGADFNITTDFSNYNKINYSRANIGLIAMYQPRKIFRFELHTGISTGRVYRLVDYDRNVTKFDSKAEPFINIGFSIVPPKRD